MNAGAIVYSILMQGAAVFKKDTADAEQSIRKVTAAAKESAPEVAKEGTELDKTGTAARKAKAPLDDAAKSSKQVAAEAEGAANKTALLSGKFSNLSADGLAAARTVGTAMLGIGTAIALVGGLAVAKFSEFEVATDRTAAASSASAEQSRELGAAALKAGADTVFSASEAANAQTELAKAGLTVKDILGGGLRGSLALAAAGELDVARAAEIASITLKQFRLDGDQAGHVADVLAAGAGRAVGSVDDLANGLKFVGPVARSMGISLEETVGVLALFAKNGIIGEQGGTAFRGMLSSLTSPSAAARKEIERLNISLYDGSTGAFLGMENAAGELSKAYAGLDDESRDASLGVLFGNEQITAARVLYQEGAAGVREMTAAVNETGYAQKQAAQLTDNLSGDIERLGGSIDTALIQTGSGANDILRQIVQGLTLLTDASGNLPAPVLGAGLALAAAAVSIALVGGGALIAIPRIVEMRAAMTTLGLSGRGVATGIGLAGTAIGLYLFFVAGAISAQAEMKATGDELRDSLDQQTGAFTAYSREIVAKKLQDSGAADQAKKYGVSLDTLTDAAFNNKAAVKELADAQAEYMDGDPWRAFDTGVGDADRTLQGLQDNVRRAPKALAELKAATDEAGEGADVMATGLNSLSGEAESALSDVDALKSAIEGFGSAQLDVNSSTRAFESAIDDLTASVEKNGQSLDLGSEAGRANSAALDDIAKSALELSSATLTQTGSQEQASAAIQRGRDELIRALGQLGITGQAAEDYADKLGLIPSNVSTAVALTGADAAQTKLDNLNRTIDILKSKAAAGINISARVAGVNVMEQADGGVVDYFARGGFGRENHIAQIARAGSMRVWAEPETGGEAYIPLAPSKRDRSIAIWQETGRRLGVERFADGGFPDEIESRGGLRPIVVFEAVSARATAIELAQLQRSGAI